MGQFLENFRPRQYADRIEEIDIAELKRSGYDALMLDLDNTLLPWQSSDVPDSSRQWMEKAKSLGMKLCIVSNTHNPKRLNGIADYLQVDCIARALKPRAYGFTKASELMSIPLERCVVVGDQLLTDIWGGNRTGIYTILVKPMHFREFVGTKVSRLVEKVIMLLLRGGGKPGTIPESNKSEEQDTK